MSETSLNLSAENVSLDDYCHSTQHTASNVEVLIASEDEQFAKQCANWLHASGSIVRVVHSGIDCVRAMQEGMPHLLVLTSIPWGGADGVLHWLEEENHDGEKKTTVILIVDPESVDNLPETFAFMPDLIVLPRGNKEELIWMIDEIRGELSKTIDPYQKLSAGDESCVVSGR